MSTHLDPGEEMCSVTEQAAAWRLVLGTHDARRVPEFWDWVTRSPLHVREALVMGLLNEALQGLDLDDPIGVDPLPASEGGDNIRPDIASEAAKKRPLLSRWIFAAAACLTLALLSAFLFRSPKNRELPYQIYTTDVGEQRFLTLNDGSTVVLDAQSSLRVQLSARERSFELEGQALFNVAHDPSRPFRVHTNATTIEVLGTEFDVRTERVTTVAVLGGVVRLYSQAQQSRTPAAQGKGETSPTSTRLAAGEAVSVAGNGQIMDRRTIDRATVTAWEQRRLVFSRVPLEEIVREFNRYNRKGRMRVEGNAASLRFGGVFDATDPSPLLFALAKNPSIIIEHNGDELIIRDKL
jgi:transmembrane sensor